MAKTRRGKKIVHVKGHRKRVGRRTVRVPDHYRSTPNQLTRAGQQDNPIPAALNRQTDWRAIE